MACQLVLLTIHQLEKPFNITWADDKLSLSYGAFNGRKNSNRLPKDDRKAEPVIVIGPILLRLL